MNQKREDYSPEQILWSEVLMRAIYDLTRPKGKLKERERHIWTAEDWFKNRKRREMPSFIWVCDTLGIDPNRTREAVLTLPRKGVNYKDVPRGRSRI